MTDYYSVTEIVGDSITSEQLERVYHRYTWASKISRGKDVLEVACGTGSGLGIINAVSRSFIAGDYSKIILEKVNENYKTRINLLQFNAEKIPLHSDSLDIILIFEAIYYLMNVDSFIEECKRVLRKNGKILIVTANKDLFDFNPSPYSYNYYGVVELNKLLTSKGFSTKFYGKTKLQDVSILQKILRPIKKLVVSSGLMPKTMTGKKLLKRLVFGELVTLPYEIDISNYHYTEPDEIKDISPNNKYKVIYCIAQKHD